MKKIFSVLLIVALVLALSLAACAQKVPERIDEKQVTEAYRYPLTPEDPQWA